MKLEGRVAVITGGSSGIGAVLAKKLAAEGAAVSLAARRRDRLEAVARDIAQAGGRALALHCDVSVREDAEELIHHTVRELGRIDILINNAGRGHFSSVEETTDRMIESVFAVNVFSLWYTTRPALVYMKKQGSGHVINIASMAGKLGFPYNSAYVAAKHACVGFTHALRAELAETGIHASVVCPAGVMTEWALVTEGGPIVEIFSESGPIVKQIATERGISLPAIEGVKPAGDVADAIMACIHHPVAEVYTHKGSREFAVAAAQDREKAERQQLPIILGERAVYDRVKQGKTRPAPEP